MKVFELLVYAIAAAALIMVFNFLVLPFFAPIDNLNKIKEGIENAKISTNLGKTIDLGTLMYIKDAAIQTSAFEKTEMLTSIECTSPKYCCPMKGQTAQECEKAFIWDSTFFTTTQPKSIQTYVRCTKTQGLYLCKIYFGGTPAQAQIENIRLGEENTPAKTEIITTIKNNGSMPLTNGTTTFELYKKSTNDWVLAEYPKESQSIEILMTGEKKELYWTIPQKNTGEYRAQFTFGSQDGGFDKKTIDFNKNTKTTCAAEQITETLFDPEIGKYKEMLGCSGCSYAYECVEAWLEKYTQKAIYAESKENAYCIKDTENGEC